MRRPRGTTFASLSRQWMLRLSRSASDWDARRGPVTASRPSLIELARDVGAIRPELFQSLSSSRSADGQDLVAAVIGDWKPGFFVDIGAGDGLSKSNTAMLEECLGWNGLLVEPNPVASESCVVNRRSRVDFRAVSNVTGNFADFYDTSPSQKTGQSHLAEFVSERQPSGKSVRVAPRLLSVETVTLGDLLDDHSAPQVIDYLSVDVEGAEPNVFSGFAEIDRRIRFISVEHNFRPRRELVMQILEPMGYRRILSRYSRNEDWFVHCSVESFGDVDAPRA